MPNHDHANSRNLITGADDKGLSAVIDGIERRYRWASAEVITASIVAYGPSSIFVVAFGFADQRTMLLSEVEPAWSEVVEALHLHLANVEPFTVWGPRLIAGPGVIDLYIAEE